MKVQDILNRIDELKPSSFSKNTLIGWLSELDGRISSEVMGAYKYAASGGGYSTDSLNTELLLPDEYSNIYIYYLQAQMDYFNGEMTRYQNAMLMFNTAFRDFQNQYNRTHEAWEERISTSLDGM